MKSDCAYYSYNKCTILKKLYCKTEKCSFYKQDESKKKKAKAKEYNRKYYETKTGKTVRVKMTEEERKAKKREYGKWYYQKHKLAKDNNINYKNYGELIFTDNEISKLKNGSLKIY